MFVPFHNKQTNSKHNGPTGLCLKWLFGALRWPLGLTVHHSSHVDIRARFNISSPLHVALRRPSGRCWTWSLRTPTPRTSRGGGSICATTRAAKKSTPRARTSKLTDGYTQVNSSSESQVLSLRKSSPVGRWPSIKLRLKRCTSRYECESTNVVPSPPSPPRRREAVPLHLGGLHLAFRPLRRADSALPQAHGHQALPLHRVRPLLLALRPPVPAPPPPRHDVNSFWLFGALFLLGGAGLPPSRRPAADKTNAATAVQRLIFCRYTRHSWRLAIFFFPPLIRPSLYPDIFFFFPSLRALHRNFSSSAAPCSLGLRRFI